LLCFIYKCIAGAFNPTYWRLAKNINYLEQHRNWSEPISYECMNNQMTRFVTHDAHNL
jgi:hypothetical protein